MAREKLIDAEKAAGLVAGQGQFTLAKDVFDVAQVALQVNVAKEGRRLPPSAYKALEALVG